MRTSGEATSDIQVFAIEDPGTTKVFLADGDALGVDVDRLEATLLELRVAFPLLRRVSAYATPLNIYKKTDDELGRLKAAGLQLLYLGLESGSAAVLKRITKGANPSLVQDGVARAHAAGIKVSATVILGLGGADGWQDHIDGTIDCVNASPPRFLSTLQLGVEDVVADEFYRKQGSEFVWQDDRAMLLELERLIAGIDPPRPIIFRSNHASNALALAGNLPVDRERLLHQVRGAIDGECSLRPKWTRGY